MLPIEVIIYIFSFLGVKPNYRCKATTLKGKTCKNKSYKRDFHEFFCLNHIKKLNRMNLSIEKDFIERCLMMYNCIKSREVINTRLENLRLYKEKRKYLTSHSGGGTFNYANIILQYGQF